MAAEAEAEAVDMVVAVEADCGPRPMIAPVASTRPWGRLQTRCPGRAGGSIRNPNWCAIASRRTMLPPPSNILGIIVFCEA